MRIGVIVEPQPGWRGMDDLRNQALAAEAAGLDLCWIRERSTGSDPTDDRSATALAAAVGAAARQIRLAVQVGVEHHPVEIAEELIVTDLISGGRVTAIIDPSFAATMLDETLEVLLAAMSPYRFAHRGERWKVPASGTGTVRVTPDPAQLELPVHVLGVAHHRITLRHGLAPIVAIDDSEDAATEMWQQIHGTSSEDGAEGGLVRRGRRIAVRAWAAPQDPMAMVASLRSETEGWGLDTCVFDLSACSSSGERLTAIDTIGRAVRPRMQFDAVPAGLAAMWAGNEAAVVPPND